MLGVTSKYGLKLALDKKLKDYENKNIVNDYIVERFFPIGFTSRDIYRVAGKIITRYESLADIKELNRYLFNHKDWLATNILQGIEAKIATAIVKDFVSKEKPILAIHDSFRILAEDETVGGSYEQTLYWFCWYASPWDNRNKSQVGKIVFTGCQKAMIAWKMTRTVLKTVSRTTWIGHSWTRIVAELFDSPEWQSF